eukprot:714764-Hanusia_phi.AAC.1
MIDWISHQLLLPARLTAREYWSRDKDRRRRGGGGGGGGGGGRGGGRGHWHGQEGGSHSKSYNEISL